MAEESSTRAAPELPPAPALSADALWGAPGCRQANTPYSTCRISPVLTFTRIASVSSRTHS